MKQLDLFRLHDPLIDSGPCSWIVCNGIGLYDNFYNIVKEVMALYNYKKLRLCKEISLKLNCSIDLLNDILRRKTLWIHLNLIESLLSMIKEKDEKRYNCYLNKLTASIDYLKPMPKSKMIVKAHKLCDEDVSKLCGAHAADGTLGLQVSIESTDHIKLLDYKELIKNNFSLLNLSKIRKKLKDMYYFNFNVREDLKIGIFKFLKRNNIKYIFSFDEDFRKLGIKLVEDVV